MKNAMELYPLSRQNLRAINRFLKEQIHKILLPKVYILEFAQVSFIHNMRKLGNTKGKNSESVINLWEIINSAKWINAWSTLSTFLISNIFLEEIKFEACWNEGKKVRTSSLSQKHWVL